MQHLFRRGGVWWARLVVPIHLRQSTGRREYVQSCKTSEIHLAKLVGAVLLARWRNTLLRLDSTPMTSDVLKIVSGAPEIFAVSRLSLGEAAEHSGISSKTLLGLAVDRKLTIYARVKVQPGHLTSVDNFELVDPAQGSSGGIIVPSPLSMPADAIAMDLGGVMLLYGGEDVAEAILADGLTEVALLLFATEGHGGKFFAPNEPVLVKVSKLLVNSSEIEAARRLIAAEITPSAIALASERRLASATKPTPMGSWSSMPYSKAVDAYCTRSDGMLSTLKSEVEVRQRRAYLMWFSEFNGDLTLEDIDSERLRAFRDGPLRDIPGNANHLKKELRRATIKTTIEALKAAGDDYVRLSQEQQQERMKLIARFFSWLVKKGYLAIDPTLSLRGEDGRTKAEKAAAERETDDETGRRQFTDEEIKQIFNLRHYQTGNGAHVVKKNAVWYPFEYWLPLLGLFCGMRIGEASQLHLSDVKLDSGVWVIDVNRRTSDKSVKTKASVRLIPVHPLVIELGFLNYCAHLKLHGYQRVFPELTYYKGAARYGKESGRKMTAMLRSLGMPRDWSLVFHCLRHNLNNALARVGEVHLAGMDSNLRLFIRYSVVGHELPDDVNAKHYTETTSAEKSLLINGVKFELPEIAPFDVDAGVMRVEAALARKTGIRRGIEDMGPSKVKS